MKLVMTLLVRDEQDIVAANIEFHLSQGVDFVIVTDNRSVDATPEILGEYVAAGVVEVIREDDDDYDQKRWVTRMARRAATDHGADWVINNDADEFWWPSEGTLRSVLEAVDADTVAARAERFNFVARPDDDRPFWDRMTIRQTEPRQHPGIDFPNLAPKTCHRAHPDIEVGQGNHHVALDGSKLEPAPLGAVSILHFPVRSYAQFENKIVKGGAAYTRNKDEPYVSGQTWRDLHTVHTEGRFAEAYRPFVLTRAEIRAGLRDDSLVEDRRLKDRLDELAGRTRVPGSLPDPPGPRRGALADLARRVRASVGQR